MKIHEFRKIRFFTWERVKTHSGKSSFLVEEDVSEEVHALALEVGHCQNRITRQRARLRELEKIQAEQSSYWQRRAEAAETILRELGDKPVSEKSQSLETVSAHYLRRYLEARDTIKRMQERREHEYWGHNDL